MAGSVVSLPTVHSNNSPILLCRGCCRIMGYCRMAIRRHGLISLPQNRLLIVLVWLHIDYLFVHVWPFVYVYRAQHRGAKDPHGSFARLLCCASSIGVRVRNRPNETIPIQDIDIDARHGPLRRSTSIHHPLRLPIHLHACSLLVIPSGRGRG
jgi:hypothetical protein